MLKGKKIVLGITGSIAAYKAAILVRLLVKAGAEVQVVMTPAAKEFIAPLTLSTLSGNNVLSEFFNERSGEWNSHVNLGLWADAMIIAPATAATIGKMVSGVADNLLVTTYLSMKAPVFVAPAMDLDMYAHPSTQRNLEILKSYGNRIIEPASGELASHLVGKGRMEEPENIVRHLEEFFSSSSSLAGKKVVITAGPTYEKIDPVRFIGNYSSGKMGFALAEECAACGADVTLVAGPVSLKTPHASIKRIDVESASEMYEAARSEFEDADAAILCAAVADFTPDNKATEKIKREKGGNLLLELKPTPDIAASLGAAKRPDQRLVGFALETNNAESNARDKLARKNLDFIVLNSLEDKGAGFAVDTNKVTIIDAEKATQYPLKSKKEVARDIVKHLSTLFVSLLLLMLVPANAAAQELKANVTLNTEKIQGTNTEVFDVLKTSLDEFINNTKWTSFEYEEYERISCNFSFVVESYAEDGTFGCTLMVQSLRPVYGSSYSTPVFKYQDNDIKFKYMAYDRLEFREDNLDNNLVAVIAFYAHLIIGMDMDTMGELGGSEFLNKAMNIATGAQSLGGTGWQSGTSTRNRFTIIDDYMNSSMIAVRQMMYQFHRKGFDIMFREPDKGREEIAKSLELLQAGYQERPLSYFPKLFTEYKQEELVNIFSKGDEKEKKKVVEILSGINPSLSSSWDKISTI
ncbi:MAG: bifunctional phosphopantothenoylcysteine decarboxylase/phosphopantothenate--cysteine ligase CoaBC [Bacteroidaceae bacterium]|nr:bifunctional phosphopantothenoylcysteine decarboxylase/phosphopantothenate--cysteine ligase CoaBC [Bacteroidaceae bacterium]